MTLAEAMLAGMSQAKRLAEIKPPWTPNEGPQRLAYESPADELFYGGAAGGGKGLRILTLLPYLRRMGVDPSDTEAIMALKKKEGKVLTPFGFKPISDIATGDQVCNPDGTVSRVIAVHDRKPQPFYRLTFIDGATVETDADHIWSVTIAGQRKRRKAKPPTIPDDLRTGEEWNARYCSRFIRIRTADLYARFQEAAADHKAGKRAAWPIIPLTAPVAMTGGSSRHPLVPPYLYGVMLGDGWVTSSSVEWMKPDTEVAEHVRREIADHGLRWKVTDLSGDRHSILPDDGCDETPVQLMDRVGLKGTLCYDKFIYPKYLTSGASVRRSLLQGLMDTDGHADKRGHADFCTSSKQLGLDVQSLARSLGYKATISSKIPTYTHEGEKKKGRRAYIIHIRGENNADLFRLGRKRERCMERPYNGGDVSPGRRLVSVEPVEPSPSRCITVDNPNGLFITDDYIVTHNSALLVGVAATRHLKSIIFRREYPQLAEIEDQVKDVIGPSGKYNHSSHVGFLPGRRIELASIPHEKDVEKYQGRPHDLIGFDEAPQFSRSQFQFVIGWNRSKVKGQRCRVILAGNPPTTPEGRWIIEEFAPWLDDEFPEPAEPGDLRWYMRLPNPAKPTERILHWFKEKPAPMPDPEVPTEMVEARSRTFIPARLEDNPMLRETGYRSVLQSMPEPLRSQLLYGDMNAGTKDDDWQVIPTDWLRRAFDRYRAMEKVRPGPPLVDGKPTPMDALGVDVARGGSDDTTLAPKYGGWFPALEVHAGTSTPDGHHVARLVIARLAKEPNQAESVPKRRRPAVRIDPIGVGTSPTDLLNGYGANVQAVDVRTATDETDRTGLLKFANVRAAMWWKFREALDPDRGDSLAICPDNKLLADVCAVHWEAIPGGIRLEPKEETAKRIGRSPDRGDALVMAHYQPARPRGGVIV